MGVAGSDGDYFCSDGVAGLDVVAGISDDDGVCTVGGVLAQAFEADGEEFGSVGVVVAEASVEEVVPDAEWCEFGLGGSAEVSGAEAEGDVLAGQGVEEGSDAGAEPGVSFLDGGSEVGDVVVDEACEVFGVSSRGPGWRVRWGRSSYRSVRRSSCL